MMTTLNLKGEPMGRKPRKKLVTLATIKGISAAIAQAHGSIETSAEMMKLRGVREVEFDGLVTINNSLTALNEMLVKLEGAVKITRN